VLQFATCSFDGFVEQFYPPLCVGARVVLRDSRLWDSASFLQALEQHGITVADLPAAYWHMLVQDYARDATGVCRLRQVHVGGEAMAVDGLDLWRRAGLGGVRLLNTYGPTEATVVSSIHDCTALASQDVSGGASPLARASPAAACAFSTARCRQYRPVPSVSCTSVVPAWRAVITASPRSAPNASCPTPKSPASACTAPVTAPASTPVAPSNTSAASTTR
jgi:Non-ribosomal peptide synthetase modules and related proteins